MKRYIISIKWMLPFRQNEIHHTSQTKDVGLFILYIHHNNSYITLSSRMPVYSDHACILTTCINFPKSWDGRVEPRLSRPLWSDKSNRRPVQKPKTSYLFSCYMLTSTTTEEQSRHREKTLQSRLQFHLTKHDV